MNKPISNNPHEVIPAWERAEFDGNKLLNGGGELPLWSGFIDPPAIGAEVITRDSVGHRCKITGYEIEAGWLMARGYRLDDGKAGNLAGIEIDRIAD